MVDGTTYKRNDKSDAGLELFRIQDAASKSEFEFVSHASIVYDIEIAGSVEARTHGLMQ